MSITNQFEDIHYSWDTPKTIHQFIQDLVDAWNKPHIFKIFTPGWASCLEESMMEWTTQYSCPGFMFVPKKPHPSGKEWHWICYDHGVSGIMYTVKLVKGKDSPWEVVKEFDNLGPGKDCWIAALAK